MAAQRSRNYPSMSLGAALERARFLYDREGKARVDAESVVKAWGYNSLNGASLRVLSALRQYGLLEGGNEDTRLSALALTLLLEPEESPDYADALHAAARAPALFQEIRDEFEDELPSDLSLVSFLVRKKNLGEPAAKVLIQSFRETMELVRDKTTTQLASPTDPNVHQRAPAEEQPNNKPRLGLIMPQTVQPFSFAWPLSKNSVLLVQVTGELPAPDDLADISAFLDMAKAKIQRDVTKAAAAAHDTTAETAQ